MAGFPANHGPATVIIPARLGSTRFPGKVLARETGMTLIEHVYRAAAGARLTSEPVIATDDERVAQAVGAFGGRFVMTSREHPNGTSRLAEAATVLGLDEDAVVVNVQGDEPEIDPGLIDAAIEAIRADDAPVATIASPFAPGEDAADPNIVKVVRRRDGRALYFSRARVPFPRDADAVGEAPLKHVGLYAYRRWFLRTYAGLDPTPLEATEKLEQLRVLEHGHAIAVAVRHARHHGIDTPEQYRAFVTRWRAR